MTLNRMPELVWQWEGVYLEAIQAPLDSAELPQRIRVAETAISQRLRTLIPAPVANSERQALAQAAQNLTHVRRAIAADAARRHSHRS
jgi:hypothetical protein